MGTRGPVPKPDATRAGHRAKSDRARKVVAHSVTCPQARPDWDPRALAYFNAASESAVSATYDSSDWANLVLLCDLLHEHYTAARPSAEMFKHAMGLSARLLLTPADRLRARIEVTPADTEDGTSDAADEVARRFAALAGDG